MRNRKTESAVIIGIAAIGVISGLAGCGSTPTASPAASTSATAKPRPVKLTAAQLAANKAAAAKAVAAAKKAAKEAAAAARKAAARAAAAAAAKEAAENTPISATQWGDVIRNPSAYVGDIYTISGTVAEYNVNSNTFATVANAALVASDSNENQFIVEADSSLLGNAQPGDSFTAKVKVVGVAQTQSTTGGGTGEAPDFEALTFTDTG